MPARQIAVLRCARRAVSGQPRAGGPQRLWPLAPRSVSTRQAHTESTRNPLLVL